MNANAAVNDGTGTARDHTMTVFTATFTGMPSFEAAIEGGTLLHWAAFAQVCMEDDRPEVKEFGDLLAFVLEHGKAKRFNNGTMSRQAWQLAFDTQFRVLGFGASFFGRDDLNGQIGYWLWWQRVGHIGTEDHQP